MLNRLHRKRTKIQKAEEPDADCIEKVFDLEEGLDREGEGEGLFGTIINFKNSEKRCAKGIGSVCKWTKRCKSDGNGPKFVRAKRERETDQGYNEQNNQLASECVFYDKKCPHNNLRVREKTKCAYATTQTYDYRAWVRGRETKKQT